MAPIRRHDAASRGFTLIEVLIAIGVLAFGLLALAAMQVHAMKFGRAGRHTTQAAVVARNEMERLQRIPWADADLSPTGNWTAAVTTPIQIQSPEGNLVEQNYARSARVTDVIAGRLRSIDIRVQWNEPGRPNRVYTISSLRYNGS